jgi:hypothetical protein
MNVVAIARRLWPALFLYPLVAQQPAQLRSGTLPSAEIHADPGPDLPLPPKSSFTSVLPDHKRSLPPVPVGAGVLPQPVNEPARLADAAPGAPCDIRLFQSQSVRPAGASRSVVGEPSVASVGDTIFQVGNWYAARSIDQGATWTHVNPYTLFPAPDGTFCCDQRVIHVPSHDIVVWILQYQYSATTRSGGIRIAVANGRADLRAGATGNWHSWYLQPGNFNRPLGEWFDFPDIAYGNTRLYFATNVFNASGQYTDSIWARFSLTELAATGGLNWGWGSVSGGQFRGNSFRIAQNGADTCYFATHQTTSTLRVYHLVDGNSAVPFSDITVPLWTNGPYVALAANGVNWAGRQDSRVLGGFQNATEYGFMWVSAPQASRPQCFVRVARVSKASNALISVQDVFHGTRPILYPAAASNMRGDFGCAVAFGDISNNHPTSGFFVVDACNPSFAGQTLAFFGGAASPSSPQWGDYITVQRHPNLPQTFISGGQRLLSATDVDARYVWFGRESEQPTTVNLFVDSTPIAGVALTIAETDRAGRKDGITNTTRQFFPDQGYSLTVPANVTSGGVAYVFDRWRWRPTPTSAYFDQPVGLTTFAYHSIGVTDDNALAVYVPVRTLNVRSTNPTAGISIASSASDLNGATTRATPGAFLFKHGQATVLTAPAASGVNPFSRWVLDGVPATPGVRTLSIAMSGTRTATAEYSTRLAGSFTAFGTGCPGTGNVVPRHTASGTPEIGQQVTYTVSNARPLAAANLLFALSNSSWQGIPLPVGLGFIGMGTCTLYVDGDLQFGVLIGANGSGSLTLMLPNDTALVGAHRYSQFLIFDPGTATPLQLVLSGAMDTRIGGLR